MLEVPHPLVTHFVWREKTGGIHTIGTVHGPNWQDEWTTRVDHDVPWIAMTNELDGYGWVFPKRHQICVGIGGRISAGVDIRALIRAFVDRARNDRQRARGLLGSPRR